MNLILFGFKGCGKTHFGKRLAEKMRCPFLDTDDLIANAKRMPIKRIYQELGEETFRMLEKEAIRSLENVQNTIIAVGGGTTLDPENVALLQKLGTLVYLKASPEKLKRRIFLQEPPAILDPEDPIGSFLKMIQERIPLYESIPARHIDLETLDEASVLAALRSILVLDGI